MGEVKKHKNESWLDHIEHSIEHHIVGVTFFVVVGLLFCLSSTVAIRKIGYGAYEENSYKISGRPLHAYELSTGWQTQNAAESSGLACLALPNTVEVIRRGFPVYYYRETAEKPCGRATRREYNLLGLFINANVIIGLAGLAGALVRHKRHHQAKSA